MKKTYNKLVRDNIPQIIKDAGKTCNVEILANDAYINALNKKLVEEVDEYLESEDAEELADILEVIYAIAKTKGMTPEHIEVIRKNKANKRGGFSDKIFLKEVIEE